MTGLTPEQRKKIIAEVRKLHYKEVGVGQANSWVCPECIGNAIDLTEKVCKDGFLSLLDAKIADAQKDLSGNDVGYAGMAMADILTLKELRAGIVGDSVPSQPLTKKEVG